MDTTSRASGRAGEVAGADRERFVVLLADPQTGELDAYGPLPLPDAEEEAERRRRECDAADLDDVIVTVVPLQPGPPA